MDQPTRLQKTKEEVKELKRSAKAQARGYILTALGLVAGLAWNDAIKALIEAALPFGSGTIVAKFIYAAIVTILIVLLTRWIMKLMGEDS